MHKGTHYMNVWQQPCINEAMRPTHSSTSMLLQHSYIGPTFTVFFMMLQGPQVRFACSDYFYITSTDLSDCRACTAACLLSCCCWHHPIKYATHAVSILCPLPLRSLGCIHQEE